MVGAEDVELEDEGDDCEVCEVVDIDDDVDVEGGAQIEVKLSDTLGLATLQRSCDAFSADWRSSKHCATTHVSTSDAKVALSDCQWTGMST